jgi:hypothetical protein
VNIILTKTCSNCGAELPATTQYFHNRKDSKDGLRGNCKRCQLAREKIYFLDNHKKIIEQQRMRNKQVDSTKRSEYNKRYREKNPEKVKETNRKYKQNHKETIERYRKKNYEKIKETMRLYRKSHPEKCREIRQRKSARKRNLPANYTDKQWTSTVAYFSSKCAYCEKEGSLTQDHFIPLSKGGEYTLNNIVPACLSCNSGKQAKDFFEWYPKQATYSKKREQKILKYLNYHKGVQQLMIDFTESIATAAQAKVGARNGQ